MGMINVLIIIVVELYIMKRLQGQFTFKRGGVKAGRVPGFSVGVRDCMHATG